MKTEDVVQRELQGRIDQVEMCLKSAKECLKENDFLQCAVRLQIAAEQGQFSDLLMNIFDSTDENKTTRFVYPQNAVGKIGPKKE